MESLATLVNKIIDFQHITKDSLKDKINRNKDAFFLNKDNIDMSIIHIIPYIRTNKILFHTYKILHPVRLSILLKTF